MTNTPNSQSTILDGITFRVACCSKLEISKDAYENRVLLECLPRYHWLSGCICLNVYRNYFFPDLLLIRSVADCTSVNQIIKAINFHHEQDFLTGDFIRKTILFRVSGHRLIELAKKMFSANKTPTAKTDQEVSKVLRGIQLSKAGRGFSNS